MSCSLRLPLDSFLLPIRDVQGTMDLFRWPMSHGQRLAVTEVLEGTGGVPHRSTSSRGPTIRFPILCFVRNDDMQTSDGADADHFPGGPDVPAWYPYMIHPQRVAFSMRSMQPMLAFAH